MYVISPLLVVALAALAGAGIMAYVSRRRFLSLTTAPSLSITFGAGLGAAAGALGALLVMMPLGFCTFEAERQTLDFVFGIGLIMAGMALTLSLTNWIAPRLLLRQPVLPAADTQPGAFRSNRLAVVFLLPTLFILALFLYYPMFDTFRLSTELARLGAPRSVFICLDNFTRLVSDAGYIRSLTVSFSIAFATIVLAISLSLLIATMAYQPIKGARIYRTLLVWPYALSPVITGIIFRLLFNPTAGVLNYFTNSLFGFRVPWLLDPAIAPWTIILASVWNIMGFNILFYIAGLQNVPSDLQEAAAIDGANVFQRFFRITFPLLSPITFFLVVTNTTYAFFDTFGMIDFLTTGGPSGATTTLMYRVYELGVVNRDLGKAAAQSLVLFMIVIGVTIIQFRTSRNRVSYGA
jgi:sn-glycerol 3-phosphate transport system permease protein